MGVYAQNKIDKKCLTKKLDVDNNFRKPIFCLENLQVIAQCNTFFKEDFVMIVFVKALFLSFCTTFLIQQINECIKYRRRFVATNVEIFRNKANTANTSVQNLIWNTCTKIPLSRRKFNKLGNY